MIKRIINKRNNDWLLTIEYDEEKDRYYTFEFFIKKGLDNEEYNIEIMRACSKTLEEAKSCASNQFRAII